MAKKLNWIARGIFAAWSAVFCSQAIDAQPVPAMTISGMRDSRHVPLNVATLVPVTEASIWQSRCSPVEVKQLVALLETIDVIKLHRIAIERFSPFHIRVAIYDPPRMLYIDAALRLKVVANDSVTYYEVDGKSLLGNTIKKQFEVC
jgi:hypothetical protein